MRFINGHPTGTVFREAYSFSIFLWTPLSAPFHLVSMPCPPPWACFLIDGGQFLRDKDSCGGGASLLDGIGDFCEDGEAQVLGAGLFRVRSSHNLGACKRRKR